VITKANLEIINEPLIRTSSLFEFDNYEDLQEKVIKLTKEENISALEFISKLTNKIIDKPLSRENVLIVEFEDERGDIIGENLKKIQEHRKSILTQLASIGYLRTEDSKIPLKKIALFLKNLEEKLKLPCFGHIGLGILHVGFKDEEDREKILDLAVKLGGSAMGEHGIGILKVGLAKKDWLIPLKRKYDAKNILNPGKVLGKERRKELNILKAKICPICGICRWRCPLFKILLRETISPRGKAILIGKGIEDELYYKCTLCRACEQICPISINLTEDIRNVREKLVLKEKETIKNKEMIQNIRKYGNPFGRVEEGKIPKELYCC
jgi:ferredoxin